MERKLKQNVSRKGLLVLITGLALAGVLFVLTSAARAQSGGTAMPIPPSPLDYSYKMPSKAMLGPGETVTYTIMLVNSRHEVVTATVADPLPPELTYVDGSATGGGVFDPASRTITWTQVSVPADGKLALKLAATALLTITTHQVVVNNALIQAGNSMPLHRLAYVLLIPPSQDQASYLYGSFKEASKKSVAPGEVFTYTIHLVNSGEADAPVSVKDHLPNLVSYVDNSASGGGVYDPGTKNLSWTGLSVPAGDSLTLTFQVTAGQVPFGNHPVPVTNVASIQVEGSRAFFRQATVTLAPAPETGDLIHPVVRSVTIGDGDVLESPTTTLHISATDNVAVKWMFIREWELATLPSPHWQVTHSSGWVPFQADYPWKLISDSGTHFVGVWVADEAKNVSHTTRRSMDFASLLLPESSIAERHLAPFLVYYGAGVNVSATLTTISGNADLFVWYPGNLFRPNQVSSQTDTAVDTVSFTTPRAGAYIFLVRGTQASTYTLGITPAGGYVPAAPQITSTQQAAPETPAEPNADFSYEPVVSVSGLDPLSQATEPSFTFNIFLPEIQH